MVGSALVRRLRCRALRQPVFAERFDDLLPPYDRRTPRACRSPVGAWRTPGGAVCPAADASVRDDTLLCVIRRQGTAIDPALGDWYRRQAVAAQAPLRHEVNNSPCRIDGESYSDDPLIATIWTLRLSMFFGGRMTLNREAPAHSIRAQV